jgi:hypothetical protein
MMRRERRAGRACVLVRKCRESPRGEAHMAAVAEKPQGILLGAGGDPQVLGIPIFVLGSIGLGLALLGFPATFKACSQLSSRGRFLDGPALASMCSAGQSLAAREDRTRPLERSTENGPPKDHMSRHLGKNAGSRYTPLRGANAIQDYQASRRGPVRRRFPAGSMARDPAPACTRPDSRIRATVTLWPLSCPE